MSLIKTESAPMIPFPIRALDVSRETIFNAPLDGTTNGANGAISAAAIGQLMDLIANQRSDLLPIQIETLTACESTREHATALLDLIKACGVAETASPCATALAISADLDKLVRSTDTWTHPAQVVRHPDAKALHNLCVHRVQSAAGSELEDLRQVLPRLERAARLAKKAASRRTQDTTRHA